MAPRKKSAKATVLLQSQYSVDVLLDQVIIQLQQESLRDHLTEDQVDNIKDFIEKKQEEEYEFEELMNITTQSESYYDISSDDEPYAGRVMWTMIKQCLTIAVTGFTSEYLYSLWRAMCAVCPTQRPTKKAMLLKCIPSIDVLVITLFQMRWNAPFSRLRSFFGYSQAKMTASIKQCRQDLLKTLQMEWWSTDTNNLPRPVAKPHHEYPEIVLAGGTIAFGIVNPTRYLGEREAAKYTHQYSSLASMVIYVTRSKPHYAIMASPICGVTTSLDEFHEKYLDQQLDQYLKKKPSELKTGSEEYYSEICSTRICQEYEFIYDRFDIMYQTMYATSKEKLALLVPYFALHLFTTWQITRSSILKVTDQDVMSLSVLLVNELRSQWDVMDRKFNSPRHSILQHRLTMSLPSFE